MSAYALAHLRHVDPHQDVLEYMERIQGTLDPFGGRFLVHGAEVEVKEGPWPGTIVVIEFPSLERAKFWRASPEYGKACEIRDRAAKTRMVVVEGTA